MSRVVGGPTVVACSPPRRSLSMSIRSLHVRWVLGEMQKNNGPREAIVVGWSLVQRPRRTRAVFPRPRSGPWTRTGLTAGDALVSNCRNLCNPAHLLPTLLACDGDAIARLCLSFFLDPPKHVHSTSGTSVALAQCTTCPTRSIGSPPDHRRQNGRRVKSRWVSSSATRKAGNDGHARNRGSPLVNVPSLGLASGPAAPEFWCG